MASWAAADGSAAQNAVQVMQIVQGQLDQYHLRDAGGSRIVLTSGSNFNYHWDATVTPVVLWVEIKNIPVGMLLLSNVLPLFGSGGNFSPPALQAKTTVAAEWTTPPRLRAVPNRPWGSFRFGGGPKVAMKVSPKSPNPRFSPPP